MSRPHEAPVGATTEWYTPPEFFDRLRLTFDLDPASPGADVVPWLPADRHYTRADDGLTKPWAGRVWLNPPYGPEAGPFIDRMLNHGYGLLLIPARTETGNFQRAARSASAVCFLRDRLHFIRDDGTQGRAAFASALLAFGFRPRVLDDMGWTVAA